MDGWRDNVVLDAKVSLAKLALVLHVQPINLLLSPGLRICACDCCRFWCNYAKVCKSASRFTCRNISLNPGGYTVWCKVQRSGKKKPKKPGWFQFVIWLKGSAGVSRIWRHRTLTGCKCLHAKPEFLQAARRRQNSWRLRLKVL